jgi:phosphonate transport system substrate-binding protein
MIEAIHTIFKKINPRLFIFIVLCLFTIRVNAEIIWVGITPWQKGQNTDDINQLYIPMFKYLSEKTGVEFKLRAMPSYEQTSQDIADGKIQLAMLSPAPYIHAKNLNPKIRILVTELSWNQNKNAKNDSYRSFILVKKDRKDLVDIKSLKDKSFAFVSEESTSGFRVPSAYFRKQKIEPRNYFSKLMFLGSHPSVTDAIAAGSIDAGATWDFNWQQAKIKNGDIFKALWTSQPIPNLCVAAHPKISLALQEKIKKYLIEVPSELLEGLSSVGFVVRPDSFYDVIRTLEK